MLILAIQILFFVSLGGMFFLLLKKIPALRVLEIGQSELKEERALVKKIRDIVIGKTKETLPYVKEKTMAVVQFASSVMVKKEKKQDETSKCSQFDHDCDFWDKIQK